MSAPLVLLAWLLAGLPLAFEPAALALGEASRVAYVGLVCAALAGLPRRAPAPEAASSPTVAGASAAAQIAPLLAAGWALDGASARGADLLVLGFALAAGGLFAAAAAAARTGLALTTYAATWSVLHVGLPLAVAVRAWDGAPGPVSSGFVARLAAAAPLAWLERCVSAPPHGFVDCLPSVALLLLTLTASVALSRENCP